MRSIIIDKSKITLNLSTSTRRLRVSTDRLAHLDDTAVEFSTVHFGDRLVSVLNLDESESLASTSFLVFFQMLSVSA